MATLNSTQTAINVPIGDLIFKVSSYKINYIQDVSYKHTVGGLFLREGKDMEPVEIILRGSFATDGIYPLGTLFTSIYHNLDVAIELKGSNFFGSKLVSMELEEDIKRPYVDCVLTFRCEGSVIGDYVFHNSGAVH
jgi:hypothetical protein